MRHAKAEGNHPRGDYFRRLTRKGRAGAAGAAEMLQDRGLVPDHIVASSATRAFETAGIITTILAPQADVLVEPELYLSSAERLIAEIRNLPAGVETVLLVAHNPGMMDLINLFTSEDAHIDLPTSGFAVIQLPSGDWAEFGPGSAVLIA